VSRLDDLQERRAYECRLTPDRALESLDEAEEFLRDRGLLTRTPDSALPSLFGACHEEPYRAGSGGFAEWPRTKYPWSFQLTELPDVYTPKIHRGKMLYLTAGTASLADPICRAEITRMEKAGPGWAGLLRHLGDAGPSTLEDLQIELGLQTKELKALRAPLERCGAVVATSVIEEPHRHTSVLVRWDHVFPDAAPGEPELAGLVVAGVRAAVVVREQEPKRWFSWTWRWDNGLIDRLVADGRLQRPEPGWLAERV
jgi:hypothetical protein